MQKHDYKFMNHLRAYLELCKPKVVLLMLLTAIVGMLLASSGPIPLHIIVFGLLGIGLASGAGAALNHLIDQHIDAKMRRTENRPLPTGRINAKQALIFAICLGLAGILLLWFTVNALTAMLTLLAVVGYGLIYTGYLKRATSQNIVIGGAAGAMPPLLGWVAVSNHIDPQALLLVLIIFVWTPPHFWALAIHREKEYAKTHIPMLPITHGIPFTKLHILLYTLLLVAATFMPFAIGMSGGIYLAGALVLNIGFLYFVLKLMFGHAPNAAIRTFVYSNFYLMFLFLFLLIDHYFFTFTFLQNQNTLPLP